MIDNLCMYGLPFASRQNEMIEMALTFKFAGIEVDLDEMVRRADAMGKEFATQFVNSAKIDVALFRLPIDFGADDAKFDEARQRLESWCDMAESIQARRCYAMIQPGNDRLAFQENFELHRQRISDVAQRLARSSITLGLAFNAIPAAREKFDLQFVCRAEELLALIKSVAERNVGLALDTWHWQLGAGGMDQLEELGMEKVVDVRIADLPADCDPEKITPSDRLPPDTESQSFNLKLVKFLVANEYQQTMAVVADFFDPDDHSRGVRSVEKIRRALSGLQFRAGVIDQDPAEVNFLPSLDELIPESGSDDEGDDSGDEEIEELIDGETDTADSETTSSST